MATVSRMGAFPLRKRARWTLKNDDSYTLEAQNRAGRTPARIPVPHSTVRFAPSPLSRRSPGGLVFWFSLVRNTSPPLSAVTEGRRRGRAGWRGGGVAGWRGGWLGWLGWVGRLGWLVGLARAIGFDSLGA